MNELTKFLVESVIGTEFDKPKTSVALFGGGFKPPTKGHLDVVNQGIKQNPEVSEVKILVGGGTRNGFTQDQAVKIWELYNDIGFIKKPATIIPVSSPFTYYKEYLKDNPDDQVYVFIGSRLDDEGDQNDVKQRSEFVKKYSDNVIPVEVSTGGGVSGTMARELFKTDLNGFRNMFPENLLDQDFDKILDILNNKSTNTTQKPASNKTEPLSPLNEDITDKTDFILPRGKKIILQAEEEDYDRGLIVELTNEGGYKINYWYGDDVKIYPAEVEVDGESIKDDANEVYIKFHPELEKENIDPAAQKKHKGKSAPFGSAYEPLNENATYSSKIDYKQQIKDLTKHMLKKGMNILPLPKVIFKHGDQENASQFLGKTAYYSPSDMTVVLYTEGRHPKDIVRSFSHEMVHHIQNLEGRLGGINTTNTQEDDNLNDIEREAYTKGNMTFRNWTDSKDGEEVTSLNEKIVGEKIECDNCGWSWNIVDGGDDLFICHKCDHDNEPENGDPFGLKSYARELVNETFKKSVTINMDPIIKTLEFEMPTGQETDENVISIIDAAPQGKVPHPVFLDFYAKFDKYFGEENDGRMLNNFGLEYLLSNVLNLSNEDTQIVINHYNTTDQDSVEWFEQHDKEEEKEEEFNIPGFDSSQDDYESVVNYRRKQLTKSLEEQERVRIFTTNCGCDKT